VHLLSFGCVYGAFPVGDDCEVQRFPSVTPNAVGDGQIC